MGVGVGGCLDRHRYCCLRVGWRWDADAEMRRIVRAATAAAAVITGEHGASSWQWLHTSCSSIGSILDCEASQAGIQRFLSLMLRECDLIGWD